MTLFSLELFGTLSPTMHFHLALNSCAAPSREDRMPDANQDEIVALFYAVGNDDLHSGLLDQGILVVQNPQLDPRRFRGYSLEAVSDELELINRIIDIVVDIDPDILVGWEVQASSWGYLNSRGSQYGRAPIPSRCCTDACRTRCCRTDGARADHLDAEWNRPMGGQNDHYLQGHRPARVQHLENYA